MFTLELPRTGLEPIFRMTCGKRHACSTYINSVELGCTEVAEVLTLSPVSMNHALIDAPHFTVCGCVLYIYVLRGERRGEEGGGGGGGK